MNAATAFGEERNILIVEDEALIALDLQRRLEHAGYNVHGIATDAAQALDLASSLPDLILMDIRIGGQRDGIEVADEIRRHFDIPVMFLTAHADAETLERAKRVRPQGYIVKPFGHTNFRAQIEVACHTYEMERKVRRSEAWLAATLANIAEAVIAVDVGNRIVFLNPAAESLTGWTAAEAKGRELPQVFCIVDPKTLLPVCVPLSQGAFAAGALPQEFHLYARRGVRPMLIECSCSPNRDQNGAIGNVIVFRDITSLRELERRNRQNRRMETVAVMAGALAHDFNNILMIILGYSDILQSDPRSRCDEVEQIRQAGIVAARIAQDLLTVSKSRAAVPEVFDLNAVIGASEKMLAHIATPASELRIELSSGPARMSAEPTEIQQILIHLATNARDTMPNGGVLTFRTTRSDETDVVLTVTDTGTGMSDETADRIFEPFFTSKGEKGTGLGMAMVHSIVKRWNGAIAVESDPGRGSVFTIRWPRVSAPAGIESPSAGSALAEPGRPLPNAPRGTILLVDDNSGVRDLVGLQLRKAGFRVIAAESGEEALVRLDLHGPVVDIVITDVSMPRMTGAELAARCLARLPRARVLFVSGYSRDILEGNELIRSGRADFIAKPFEPQELLARIDALVGSE